MPVHRSTARLAKPGEIDDTATVGESMFRRIRGDIVAGVLKPGQKLKVENAGAAKLVAGMVEGIPLDKRFCYYLLAATGICVVPISSFCSDLLGFRVTLLEEDPKKMEWLYARLKAAVAEYLAS